MKLHVLSDLHVELADFRPPATNADVVVLAGDIANGPGGIIWAREAFPSQEVVYVPGNHEYYHSQRDETLAAMRIAAQERNVHLLDEEEWVFSIRDTNTSVRFLGCTLWTNFCLLGASMKPMAVARGKVGLADFRLIKEPGGNFGPARSIDLHEQAMAWLKRMLGTPFDGVTVVVTHHLPSAQSVAERFKQDSLSPCFASNLDYLFGKMALWIHGHTHDSIEYVASGTHVICNPRGYVTQGGAENAAFNPRLVIQV